MEEEGSSGTNYIGEQGSQFQELQAANEHHRPPKRPEDRLQVYVVSY